MTAKASSTVSLVSLRNSLGEVVSRANFAHERTLVSKNGKTVAAVVPIEDLERLEAFEDRADLEALREARCEDDGARISWEDFKAGGGL